VTPRTRNILLGTVGVLAVLVIGDTFGLLPKPGESDAETDATSTSARQQYIAAAGALARDRALLARAPEVAASLERARTAWGQVRAEMIVAPTLDQAEAAFRERVLAVTKDFSLTAVSASPLRIEAAATTAAATPATGSAVVRPVALRLQFDTAKPQDAYRLIDLLEHMPDLRSSVTNVSLVGPGLPQIPSQLTVNVTVRTVASIGGPAQ